MNFKFAVVLANWNIKLTKGRKSLWFARGYSWSGINSFLLSFGSRLLFGFTFYENSRNSSNEWRQPLVTLISFEFLSSTTKLHNLRERYVILSAPTEVRGDSKYCKVAMKVDIMHMCRGWLDRFWNEPHIFFCYSWVWIVDWTYEVYGSSERHSWATVSCVGTPPSEPRGTHLTVTHDTHLSSGSSSSGPSHKAHMARFSRLPQGRSNGTYKHIIRTIYTMHPDDQHRPSGYNGPDHWLKYSESYTLSRQPAMAHVPLPAEWNDGLRWQQVTSHDL